MRIARLIYDAAELVGLLHVSQQDGSVANSYGIIRTSSRKLVEGIISQSYVIGSNFQVDGDP